MKTLFQGLIRAKFRTVLNALIILLVTISVGIVLAMPFNFDDKKDFRDAKTSTTQSTQSENSKSEQTESSDSKNENIPQKPMQNPQNNGFSTAKIIVLSGIAIVGALLLVLVNFISTNCRKEEIAKIHANGISMGDIKKQFFKEALLTVLFVGIIGSAAATFVSRPIANAVFKNEPNFSQSDDFNDEDLTPPAFDGANDNKNSGNFTPPTFDKKSDFRGNNFLLIALTSLGYTVVLSVVSGVFCGLPIKKDKKGTEIQNEQ